MFKKEVVFWRVSFYSAN